MKRIINNSSSFALFSSDTERALFELDINKKFGFQDNLKPEYLTTGRDNLKYKILKEEKQGDIYFSTIEANNKIFIVKYNILNEGEKINKAVYNAYGKL